MANVSLGSHTRQTDQYQETYAMGQTLAHVWKVHMQTIFLKVANNDIYADCLCEVFRLMVGVSFIETSRSLSR